MNEQARYRGGFVWPVILIGAGVVFLLNNLGLLPWNVWNTLLQLWPVLLIAVGLDILVGRRFPLGSALLGLLLVVVLVFSVTGAVPQMASAGVMRVERTVDIQHEAGDIERATVDIRFGTGSLNIAALPEGSKHLVDGSADLSRGEGLENRYSGANGIGRLFLQSQGAWMVGPEVLDAEGKDWTLNLNRGIPLDLEIDAGAGQSMLDLSSLNLRRLDVNGGVGQVTVKLPARGRYEVQIDGGVGQMIVMAPEGLAVRVSIDDGLGGVDAQGGFRKQGEDYVAGDFNTAEHRASVRVDGGVGRIVLKTLTE